VIVRLGLDQRQFPMTNAIYAEFLRRIAVALGS